MSTIDAIEYLNSIPQVGESIRQVPISTPAAYKDRFSAMLKYRKIDPASVDWNLVVSKVKFKNNQTPKFIFL